MNKQTLVDFIDQMRSGEPVVSDTGIMSIKLSKDGSALVLDDREVHALCHFCDKAAPFEVRNKVAFGKPAKWAMLYSRTRTFSKRFFICEGCCKVLAHTH